MNPNQLAAFKILQQAQQAMKSGDNDTARQLASEAAQMAPELEEVWLLSAALASPQDSIAFLDKALKINPNSERAKKGMAWAQSRLQHEPEAFAAPPPVPPASTPAEESKNAVLTPTPAPVAVAAQVETDEGKQSAPRRRIPYLTLLVILLCLVLALAGWQGVTPVAAFFTSELTVRDHGPAWAQADISKANASQPLLNATSVPTETNLTPTDEPVLVSPTPTGNSSAAGETSATLTAAPPTATAVPPTDTLVAPTQAAPSPTESVIFPTFTGVAPTQAQSILAESATPLPTVIEQATATSQVNPAVEPSPTPLPTDTDVPSAASVPQATPIPNPSPLANTPGGVTGRWIDVDITHQMVYAYEGNTVVKSFLVSTGIKQYPTVTGQYHIYVKYRYKDMSGPGYYLPNVPFTMFFYEGYALHGTYWHHNFGTPMSHGCVNLSIPDSEWMYNFASVGTLVNVHY